MKVLHLSSEKSWRGGEQQIAYLIDELQKKGVENFVACRNNSDFLSYCEKNEIKHFGFNFKNQFDLSTIFGIKKVVKKYKIDFIHIHSGKSHGIAVLSHFFGANAKLILSRRVDFLVKKKWSHQFKYNYKGIEKILCVSDKIREIVSASIKEPNKCVTVHSGIDLKRFEQKNVSTKLRKEYNIEKSTPIIGNASSLADHKDLETFIRTAHYIIKEEKKDYKFFLIGKGEKEQVLKVLVKELGIESHVVFTGFRNDIPEVLPELDVFLMTSKTEGLGTTLLDAIACQVPIVATKSGGIPEIVIHEKTGLLAKVKDFSTLAEFVIRMIEDTTLRTKVVSNANTHLLSFTKEATAEKTYQIYKELLLKGNK